MKRPIVGALLALLALGAGANGTQGADTTTAAPGGAGAMSAGRNLFTGGTTPSCAVCHTLSHAGATGNIGPDLDALQPDAARVANAVRRGFENMPAFGHVLSADQIDTLARYVAEAAGK